MITNESDGTEARIAAHKEGERIQAEIRELEAKGMFGAAEMLQARWEREDLRSETWGECYLRLINVRVCDQL